jgi:hypothetical protein
MRATWIRRLRYVAFALVALLSVALAGAANWPKT